MTPLCGGCHRKARWGLSHRCFDCLLAAQLVVEDGQPLRPLDDGRGRGRSIYAARYRFRKVRCGRADCEACAHAGYDGRRDGGHGWYVYRVWREPEAARETYLGPAAEEGDPYTLPFLRSSLADIRALASRVSRTRKRSSAKRAK